MLLGRRLLAPLQVAGATSDDAALRKIQLNDRFFCETMESIPPQYYFPTDEEENWLKSQPKGSKKYHRVRLPAVLLLVLCIAAIEVMQTNGVLSLLFLQDVLAQNFQESSKKSFKRAKFSPSEQKTNEERQLETAEDEKRQKKKQVQKTRVMKADKNPSATSLDGLKERLALKIQAHREQRKADEKTGKKRKENGAAKIEPAQKKRKTGTASLGSAFNNKTGKKDAEDATEAKPKATSAAAASVDVSVDSISYGSLLLVDEKKPVEKKTRNGQGIRGIKNLLKKAERNQQRMDELKKTEEGKAVVEAKQWNSAIKQAAGELVMDDPKLLRNKLKKKEKAKAKSTKEWCVAGL